MESFKRIWENDAWVCMLMGLMKKRSGVSADLQSLTQDIRALFTLHSNLMRSVKIWCFLRQCDPLASIITSYHYGQVTRHVREHSLLMHMPSPNPPTHSLVYYNLVNAHKNNVIQKYLNQISNHKFSYGKWNIHHQISAVCLNKAQINLRQKDKTGKKMKVKLTGGDGCCRGWSGLSATFLTHSGCVLPSRRWQLQLSGKKIIYWLWRK